VIMSGSYLDKGWILVNRHGWENTRRRRPPSSSVLVKIFILQQQALPVTRPILHCSPAIQEQTERSQGIGKRKLMLKLTFGLYSAFLACNAIVFKSNRHSRLTVATIFLDVSPFFSHSSSLSSHLFCMLISKCHPPSP